MAFPPPKKKKPDLTILMGEPEEKPGDSASDAEPDEDEDDLSDDLPFGDEDDAGGADEFDDTTEPSIDPEHAALLKRAGITDPDQQSALVELIKMVKSDTEPMGSSDTGGDYPPLPESTY